MAKTPKGQPSERKTRDAVAADRQLRRSQDNAGMAPGERSRQNARVAKKIINRGQGLRKSK